jgi:hypothetical protein
VRMDDKLTAIYEILNISQPYRPQLPDPGIAVLHYATNQKVAGSIPDEVNF